MSLKHSLAAALAVLAAVLSPALQAQTCSVPGNAGTVTITAQPNTFFPGSASVAAGATSISLGASAGAATAIAPGDLVLVIQMQGADINTSNANTYGAGTAGSTTATVAFGASGYAGGTTGTPTAGNYEWAVATNAVATTGGTLNLSSPLVSAYSVRASSTTVTRQTFQVIRVPQYSNLTLGATIDVLPWNGSTGGVLVLEATGDIAMAGNIINGTGRGFRGAGAVNVDANTTCTTNWNTTGCQGYVQTIAAALGASKGEGIAGTPARIYTNDPAGAGTGTVVAGTVDGYPVGEAARGAPGNAGGGGNQHNAGGGGGGNGGAGGKGGNTWNSSTSGNAGLPYGGFGGSPSGASASRWIMGGGGGAGDLGGNGSTSPDGSGGAGGALVVLRASRISGGGTINVNGAAGQNTRTTDASGGGGAGGTVVVAVGAGGLNGAYTVNANGASGGSYGVSGLEQDGPGGGGGGGAYISNAAGATVNVNGGAGGGSSTTAGCGGASNACNAATGNGGGSPGYAIVTPGVLVGYECLPNLAITKATTTPLVTSSTGATAAYTIAVSNSGGGARFVSVKDLTLPPGWTLNAASTYTYGTLPATRLPAGGETVAPTTTPPAWTVNSSPLTTPTLASNSLTWTSFAVPPITSGVPGQVTISFIATIPDQATVGTYHNGAGAAFLDPTRQATLRTVAPAPNVAANRPATAYDANTAYLNFAGAGATNVAGSNYSGLQAGPTSEDVRLIPDFSVTKTGPSSATPGVTFTYTITARNNGRPVGTQAFSVTQANDVTSANVPSVLGSSPLTVTDTLAGNATLTTLSGTGWTCGATGTTRVCTLANANAYPIAASTDFSTITGTATITPSCTLSTASVTNSVAVSAGAGETVATNNTATVVTTPTCSTANIALTKSDSVTSIPAGATTTYTLTITNTGAGNANGTVVQDPATAGLSCSAVTCTATTGGAICPTPLTIAALQGAGLTIATFPASSSVTLGVVCGVTATGQ